MKRLIRAAAIGVLLVAVTSCLLVPPTPTDDQRVEPGAESTAEPDGGSDRGLQPDDSQLPPGDEATSQAQGTVDIGETTGSTIGPETEDGGSVAEVTGSGIPHRILSAGNQSAVRRPVTVTVGDQAGLEEVWYAIHANQLPPPELPSVDFEREVVVVLILGERPSAGYAVRTAGLSRSRGAIELLVEVEAPDPSMMHAAVLVSPYEISAIGIANAQVRFAGDDVGSGFDAE